MTASTAARRFLWLIDLTPGAVAQARLRDDLPEGLGVQAVDPEGEWKGPARARPIGVVLAATDDTLDRCLSVLSRVADRSVLQRLVLVERPSAEQRHRLMRAGATAIVDPGWRPDATEGTRTRARLRLHRTVELMEEASDDKGASTSKSSGVQLVAIGSSTGGPEILKHVLAGSRPFRVPVVIAQHVSRSFDVSLAEWLTDEGMPCSVARDGEAPRPGHALLAPATEDLVLDEEGLCRLLPSESHTVPSADRLLASVAQHVGRRAVGLVLTGMGRDGAQGLLALQHAGGFTITQRGDTCIVDGMPASARALNAHCRDWTPDEIRGFLDELRV